MRKPINWNEDKNEWLKKERNISFEDILLAIKRHKILDIVDHTNADKYPNQKIFNS